MNEEVKLIYEKYQKMNLDIKEMSEVIGVSVSKTTKMFSDYGEKKIIEEKLLPPFKRIGNTRLFPLTALISWANNTEMIS